MADAIIVGAGPNGLAAAITLARAGVTVTVLEAEDDIGGGTRSAELTLPGFHHDICSAVHPFAVASPFLRELRLHEHGLEWVHPDAPLGHPFNDGTAIVLDRSLDTTAAGLGNDAPRYRAVFAPLVRGCKPLFEAILGPLFPPHAPVRLARFATNGLQSATAFAGKNFRSRDARALFAGSAAHSLLPLEQAGTAAFGLLLTVAAHGVGWPLPRGGAQRFADALASYFRLLGGQIETGVRVRSLDELNARAILLDVTPRQLLAMCGDRLPASYRRNLERFRYGPAAFKVDWALDAPIPWKSPELALAGTVHVGGTLEDISAAEREMFLGGHPARPFVLLGQPTLFDPSRAPTGKHIAWAYCHVPLASPIDMTERIEAQVERFAPGFRERILARHVLAPAALERHNSNLVGGDISGGRTDLWQLFFRPTLNAYVTPLRHVYLCSSSTPPGPGVHGMCGHRAALAALRRSF